MSGRVALHAVLRALLALVLASGLALPLAATTAGPARGQSGPLTARVVLDALSPAVPRPGGVLRISGRVQNLGTETVRDVSVRLRLSRSRVPSRGELQRLATGESTRRGTSVAGSRVPLADLAPGTTTPFTIAASLDGLGLGEFGVYPLAVEVRGSTDTGFGQVGVTRTFLPWAPEPLQVEPIRLLWLWPLADRPRRQVDGVFVDDDLAASLAPGGRLRGLVQAAAGRPVTWVVDPMLLDDAADMSDGYAVAGPAPAEGEARGPAAAGAPDDAADAAPGGDEVAPEAGAGEEAARTFLDRLRAASGDARVLALPYADPDVVAARRAGLGGLVANAREQGAAAAERVLGRDVPGDIALPPEGWLDDPTAALLAGTGVRTVVLAGGARRPLGLPYTPTGRTTVPVGDADLAAVLVDERLSDVVTADVSRAGTGVLARQRFLAETAMVTAERPGISRVIAIAPPRRWAATPDQAGELLALTETAPWMRPAGLGEMLAEAPPDVPREPLRYPADAAAAELPAGYLADVREIDAGVRTVTGVLSNPADLPADYARQQQRLASAGLRSAGSLRSRLLSDTEDALDATLDAVRVLPTRVQLPSREESFPVTVVNDLDQAVTVRLRLESDSPRLSIAPPQQPQVIEAGGKRQVPVTATAVAAGAVTVRAWLTTPDGAAIGDPVLLRVQVAQYGPAALLITAGAALLLFLAAARNVARRVRRARERPTPGATETAGPVHPGAAGDGSPPPPDPPDPRAASAGRTRGRHVG